MKRSVVSRFLEVSQINVFHDYFPQRETAALHCRIEVSCKHSIQFVIHCVITDVESDQGKGNKTSLIGAEGFNSI